MPVLLAALPIALVVGAMLGLRWRAASAGALGLGAALVVGAFAFDYGGATVLAGTAAEAGFLTVTILWIIFPALCLYEAQLRAGAFETIRSALVRVADDLRIQVLLVAWFFGLFMEGVAGFGTPVALAAPLLVALGIAPVRAVVLALVGHAAGVSFGAVGTPVMAQMGITGLDGQALAWPAAALHATLGLGLVAALFRLAAPGWPPRAAWGWPVLAAALFLGPSLALAAMVGPELPTLAPALVGGAAFALVARRHAVAAHLPGPPAGALLRAALPYLVLMALILATRLLPPLREPLRAIEIAWTLPGGFSGRIEPLYHPGTLLLIGFLLGGVLQGQAAGLAPAMARALRRLAPVALALLAMLMLSRVLVHGGMIAALAQAAAASGAIWPVLAPFVGVLGTFVTGSATASNILFTGLQQGAAEALGLTPPLMHGAQNFGAAIGNIVSPHNIIAGAATVALAPGREGEVLRLTLPICGLYALAGGVLVWLAG
ncbi:L-lactate permease [Plastorhodobacter daqingensis]|uniref:L-lactate permease n=1 Tax=Plastorhodobacter daqingensis TaxID=1387281 RepID=A0ABW2UM58_9RHOB